MVLFWLSAKKTPTSENTYHQLIDSIPSMHQVNDFPTALSEMMITLCRIPTKSEIARANGSPHAKGFPGDMYINVYVNKIGFEAMTSEKAPEFPEGSLIIKEKFSNPMGATKSQKNIELYTIMLKREKGYNSECGDWEFISVNGNLNEQAGGKLDQCISCHLAVPETDYVFRKAYLSAEYKRSIYSWGNDKSRDAVIKFKAENLGIAYRKFKKPFRFRESRIGVF